MKMLRTTVLAASIAMGFTANAAIITISNDTSTNGLNDTTPVAPVAGNPGITVGAQRWFVYQVAANRWGSLLANRQETRVRVEQRTSPACSAQYSGIPGATVVDLSGGEVPGLDPAIARRPYDFPVSLMNARMGRDFTPSQPHVLAAFGIPNDAMCSFGWYHGVESSAPSGQAPLLDSAMQAIAEGLGFGTGLNADGTFRGSSVPYISSLFVFNADIGKQLGEMTPAERMGSVAGGNILWQGISGTRAAYRHLDEGVARVYDTNGTILPGDFEVIGATFGPRAPENPGLTLEAVLVNDGNDAPVPSGSWDDGCTAPRNDVRGKIAVIRRGGCTFLVKATNAQNAGARAVLFLNTSSGAVTPGADDPTMSIRIPMMIVSPFREAIGLHEALATRPSVVLTMVNDETAKQGIFPYGNPRMTLGPDPYFLRFHDSGSPRLLMQNVGSAIPSIDPVTLGVMQDIGWELNFPPMNRAPQVVSSGSIMAKGGIALLSGIGISDPEGNDSVLFATLDVGTSGMLQIDEARATNVKVFGNGSSRAQLIGKATNINAAFAMGAVTLSASDAGTLNISVSDAGGTGAPLSTTRAIAIVH